MEELVKSTAQISNKELKKYTIKIRNCGENIRKNYIKIAYLLNKVDTTECYIEDGFVNTQDYARHILGIQRTACYNLLRIGKDYINEDGTCTILKCDDSDFGVSQIQALLPLGIEESKTLVETGEITPEMSVRQIKKIVSDKSENDASGDVIDEREDWYDVPSDEMTIEQARQAVKDLRKKLAECLEQELKTGNWIEHPEIETSTHEYLMFYECSECGDKQCFCKSDIHKKHFCNNCGVRMVEPQESEEAE